MVIFHSFVSLPEGNHPGCCLFYLCWGIPWQELNDPLAIGWVFGTKRGKQEPSFFGMCFPDIHGTRCVQIYEVNLGDIGIHHSSPKKIEM